VEPGPKVTANEFDRLIAQARSLTDGGTLEAVREWKGAHPGGKAVGAFPVYVPTELIQAAGALPVSLFGAGGSVEISHADSRIQSFVCSISRSTLELGLRGQLDVLDGMVFPSICDVARNLSGVWSRNFPDRLVEFLHLPQNRDSPSAIAYAVAEYRRFLSALEKLTGRTVRAEDVAGAIEDHNAEREAVSTLLELRRSTPWLLDAWESGLLLRAGSVMERGEHAKLLRRAVTSAKERGRRSMDRVRVLVLGAFCEQPPLELVRTIEEAGCYILEDDLLLGLRWFPGRIVPNGDPLHSLAEAYVTASPASSVSHYRGTPKQDNLVQRVRDLDAAGVVFCTAKFCEPALYDQVLYMERLEGAGVPYVHVEFEEKMSTFDNVRTQVETFVESILFE
jgi:benzoyl-CoA reductase subunit C